MWDFNERSQAQPEIESGAALLALFYMVYGQGKPPACTLGKRIIE